MRSALAAFGLVAVVSACGAEATPTTDSTPPPREATPGAETIRGLLLGLGLIMVLSASSVWSQQVLESNDMFGVFKKQFVFALLGLARCLGGVP